MLKPHEFNEISFSQGPMAILTTFRIFSFCIQELRHKHFPLNLLALQGFIQRFIS